MPGCTLRDVPALMMELGDSSADPVLMISGISLVWESMVRFSLITSSAYLKAGSTFSSSAVVSKPGKSEVVTTVAGSVCGVRVKLSSE